MSEIVATKTHLLTLFDRPKEYTFIPKGDEKRTVFKLAKSFIIPEYSDIHLDITNSFDDNDYDVISIPEVPIPPLDDILKLPRDENFSLYIPKHRKIAGRLIDIFLGVKHVNDLLPVAIYIRDRVNPYLFNYCFSVALFHRSDTQDLDLPAFIHSFPDKFLDSRVFTKAREYANVIPEGSRKPIEIQKDFTASDLDIEHRMFYFREDLGVNLHYWHFNLIYPFEAAIEIVKKDRRGELFYYMHQQILARYNFERLCNKLRRVERLINFEEPIEEAYFSKLDSLVASKSYPPRIANQTLKNLRRDDEDLIIDISQLKLWRDRLYEAVKSGIAKSKHDKIINLTESSGIDILGNMIQSSILSPNREYYGDFHNMGKVFLSFIHDPENKHLESFSVIGDPATAMRDPVFYRWHAFIDNIFQSFNSALPKYTVEQLNYQDITIQNFKIDCACQENVIQTFWQQSDVDLSGGMDFQPRGAVFVRFTHLNHEDFKYKITVNNKGHNHEGMVRIFLAPKYDETGATWHFKEQKNMFIELDKFRVSLKHGQTIIIRSSTQSSVTIPFDRMFGELTGRFPKGKENMTLNSFCGCGWPQHMLVPKGTPEGFECELFVMISDYEKDYVVDQISGICNDAHSYCGIKDKKYPDRRPMGYPFDRLPRDGVDTLEQFLTPNMKVVDCKIKFSDKTVKPKKGK